MRRFQRLGLLAILVSTALLYVVKRDHDATRPARLDVAACRDNMINLSDALLLYERTHRALPKSLDALVPRFVSEQMIYCREGWKGRSLPRLDPRWKYAYDPVARRIADPLPHALHGLIFRHARIQCLDIPRQTDLNALPGEAKSVAPPAGSLVIEAEMFSALNYGWEITSDLAAGGGAIIENKEGVANSSAMERGAGDFFNIGNNRDIAALYYTFRVPETGTWVIQARVRTGGTHCSNVLRVFLDGEDIGSFGGNHIVPFSWVWDDPKPVELKAGPHEIRVYPWEDGIAMDQILISRTPVSGHAVFRANAPSEAHGARALFLAHSLDTCVLDLPSPPHVTVWLRRTRETNGWARLRTTLALPDGERELLVRDFSLASSGPLVGLPVSFAGIDGHALPSREYLLKSVLSIDGQPVCQVTTVLLKPYPWQVFGMLPFADVDSPLLPDDTPTNRPCIIDGQTCTWRAFEPHWYNQSGVLDFGLMFATNSLHAPTYHTVCGQTRIRVRRDGQYLLKCLSDDQMALGIDGQRVARIYDVNCAIRTAQRVPIHLTTGEHTLQFRLNQYLDCWQAGVFIRTADDQVTPDVEGVK